MSSTTPPARATKERTISFYEIVKVVGRSENKRMPHSDWDAILETIEGEPLGDRVYSSGKRTLIGEVLRVDGRRHMKLLLVRDQDGWLSVYDPTANSVDDLNLGEQGQLVETSIVAFMQYGNVIGLIQGSPSAPGVGALEEWLTGIGALGAGVELDSQPLVSHEAQQKLTQSSEASSIEVKVHTNRADALEKRGSGLSRVLRAVNSEYGPMTVTVILQASRKRDQAEGRRAVREEAQKILDASDAQEVAKASAKLIFIDADDRTRTEGINFVKQRITAKRNIPTTGDDGSPVRNEAAVRAILEVADQHDAELRAIVEAPAG
jgi:hypothetical protein